MDKFAALVPSEDTLESATELRISIMDKFKDLGAIIYDSNCNEITAIFKNTIRISIYTNGVNENYWILKIDVFYCPLSLIERFCPPSEYPRLNLHKEITTKFYQFCMMALNRAFNIDIAHNILSFIDFTNIFIPLPSDRCARISPELLINIMIVLSEQDIKNEALNGVMHELVPLIDSCSTVNKDGSGYGSCNSILRYGEMETWVANTKYLAYPIIFSPSININACSIYNADFDDDQVSVWDPYDTTAIRANLKTIHMYKKLHKIWHRYSFHLGLIYKLVRENELFISQRARTKLQLIRAKL
jgi:hypothetical protein